MKITLGTMACVLLSTAVLAPAQGQQYVISTYVGGTPPPTPVLGLDMPIGYLGALAGDEWGNAYFGRSNCVFRLDRNGLVTRVAGNCRGGYSGDGGPATEAQLFSAGAIAVDGAGNLFIADSRNHRIRMVSPDGIITTVAGNGEPGFSGDGGPATAARVNYPQGLAVDGAGNLFIVLNPTSNPPSSAELTPGHRIRRVAPDGIITTVAGNGVAGFSGDGGPANTAQLSYPHRIAADRDGNLFIGGSSFGSNQRIRRVSPDGLITTVVNSETSNPDCLVSFSGLNHRTCGPGAVAVDRAGNLYFTEYGAVLDEFGEVLNEADTYLAIRKRSPDGTITTVAGNRTRGYSGDGGLAVDAQIMSSSALAVDGAGDLFFADSARVRKISTGGIITTVAGNGTDSPEPVDGEPSSSVQLSSPSVVAVDSAGNLFIRVHPGIRRVSPAGIITTVVHGVPCDYGRPVIGEEPPCLGAMTAEGAGNLLFVDRFRIRRLSPDGTTTTIAGNGEQGYSGDGGPAANAHLSSVGDMAVDGAGNLFFSDGFNRRVRKVSPDGIITTVAGNGTVGKSGDGGLATKAQLYAPGSVAVDGEGNLFISEVGSIRKVSRDGIIHTITDNRSLFADYSGDGGPATSATGVSGRLAADAAGNLFIAFSPDRKGYSYIRKISPDGIITTVVGNNGPGYSGDGGLATEAQVGASLSMAADGAGNVYFADTLNNAIRVLRPINGPF